jgi:hypothetical protein
MKSKNFYLVIEIFCALAVPLAVFKIALVSFGTVIAVFAAVWPVEHAVYKTAGKFRLTVFEGLFTRPVPFAVLKSAFVAHGFVFSELLAVGAVVFSLFDSANEFWVFVGKEVFVGANGVVAVFAVVRHCLVVGKVGL